MPRSLRWLPEAVADLARLREFIRIHDPDAAERAGGRIREAARKLLAHPFIGRPVLDIDRPQLRDIFIPFGQAGYRLRYAVTDDAVIIVKIWHGRENKDPAQTS
ncbi:MAG: type II toxin-antitoxin system RelE/ParE family toxin [Syntrophobacteraceae bacterium]